ncbi:CHASE3 domain-containing protein [Hyphomicrobium sp. 802]|uniref:sensor histidine kinase n=1 Tax=Hyphomicrobium sp. 802 TaxID=1112272 RepID=UPI00045E6146|nr:CHASE3 domain-containing protein [Hyphomicrobium sp. 802]
MSANSSNLLRVTYVFAAAGVLTLVVLVAVSFWLLEKTTTSTRDVIVAREQLTALSQLLSSIQDAETGQRGYLLTGESRYLEPYNIAIEDVPRRMADVRDKFKDQPQLKAGLDKIAAAIAAKLRELASTVELRMAGKSSEALAVVNTDRGKNLMDDIRKLVAEQTEVVETELTKSIQSQQDNAVLARWFTLGAGVVILLAALGAVATILRYTRALLATRGKMEQLNMGLEERVKERTADLQRANDEIQRFAYIVSHDLRAPLVNVMGYTSELEAGLATLASLCEDPKLVELESGPAARTAIREDLPESIGFIRTSTHKMDGLIKAILKLSREGQRILRPETVDLEEFFDSAIAAVQHRVTEADGEIEVLRPMPTIETDRLALEQVFGNLIDNALKYTMPGRAPKIIIEQVPSRWGAIVIEVRDNGRGIAADDAERVFDLFRRAGAQDKQGEGIGLAHVKTLIRRLGGEITMTSELKRGTTFRVMLPRKLPEKPNAQ